MTIRYTCPDCSSVLKIKDELGGAHAHCPKCKAEFVVPMPAEAHHESTAEPSNPQSAPPDPHPRELSTPSTMSMPATMFSASDQNGSESISAEHVVSQPQSMQVAAINLGSNAETDLPPHLNLRTANDAESKTQSVAVKHFPIHDSDSEIDELTDANNARENRHVAVASSKAASTDDDDDDLDCPPVFVSSMPAALKPKASVKEPSESSRRSPVNDVPVTSRRPSPPLPNHDAFGPMKLLSPDSPGENRQPFPAKSPIDMELSLSNDTLDDLPDRPTPQPQIKKAPSSSSNRVPVENVDLATAAKMMRKAIKDSQAEMAHQSKKHAEPGYDYFLFLREFGARGFALLGGSVAMVFVLYFFGQYTFGSQLKLPKLGYVHGTVKLDGLPLSEAIVSYEPVEKKMDGHNRARTSTGVTDGNGYFKMMYVDKIEGVAAGKCYVSVSHLGSKGNDVPVEWMAGAQVTRDVTPGHQKSPADIEMVSKK